jgi:threonine dehydrogenase-like Zn-dependent dehydrogenase
MKALVLHGPNKYKVENNWPEPEVKHGWVKIRVSHSGICGSDLPRFGDKGSYYHPVILGHEFSGVVEEVAPDSTLYKGGELVAVKPLIPCKTCQACQAESESFSCERYNFLGSRCDGSMAEYCVAPEENLILLPEGVDSRTGAFIEPIAVALHAVRRSCFEEGKTAFVFGCGSIGLLIGTWLKILGAKHIVLADIRRESLEIAQKMGFDNVINPLSENVKEAGSFDFIYEAAGAQEALTSAISLANHHGVITSIGRSTRDIKIAYKNFESLMRKELNLVGCWGYKIDKEADFINEMLRQKRLNVNPLITHEVTLDDAPDMIGLMMKKEVFFCKVLIKM